MSRRILWAASVLLLTAGLIVMALSAGASADNQLCTDGGERGVVTLDGTCMTPTAYAAEYGDGVNVAFDPDQGFQSFEEWVATLYGAEMIDALRADTGKGGQYDPDEGCFKIEFEDGVQTWTSTVDGTVTVKAGPTTETYTVRVGDVITHSTGKDLSHVILCPVVTTTTVPKSTTTTVVPTTTTTTVPVTSTTVPPTTTSLVTTTTTPSCGPGSPLWNPTSQLCELPFTGVGRGTLGWAFGIGLALLVSGFVSVGVTRMMDSD